MKNGLENSWRAYAIVQKMRNDRLVKSVDRVILDSRERSFGARVPKKVTKNRRHGNETITFFFLRPLCASPARINDAQWRLWETFVPLSQNLSVSGHHVRKNTLPFSSFFALLPPIPVFSTPPLAAYCHGISFGKMCCVPRHWGNECFFFPFFGSKSN